MQEDVMRKHLPIVAAFLVGISTALLISRPPTAASQIRRPQVGRYQLVIDTRAPQWSSSFFIVDTTDGTVYSCSQAVKSFSDRS